MDLVELDVTESQTIFQCKEMVAKRAGGKLDVLVSIPVPNDYLPFK